MFPDERWQGWAARHLAAIVLWAFVIATVITGLQVFHFYIGLPEWLLQAVQR
jgi:hypothetical protein